MLSQQLSALLRAQSNIIGRIALRESLGDILETICLEIEAVFDDAGISSSILILEGNCLVHGAAPSLPTEYCAAIDGIKIGPKAGSCGTAVFRRGQVFVNNIATDPLWDDYRDIAASHGLMACWSTPIFSSQRVVLGSFAVYYREPKTPDAEHLELIQRFTNLAGMSLEMHHAASRERKLISSLQTSNAKLKALTDVIPEIVFVLNQDGICVDMFGSSDQLGSVNINQMVGQSIGKILPGTSGELIAAAVGRALLKNELQNFEIDVKKIWDVEVEPPIIGEVVMTAIPHYNPENPDEKHVLMLSRDITSRKQAEERIEQLAFYDPLTGLANRRLVQDRLEKIIQNYRRYRFVGALLFLDLDDFKRINDSLGHSVGDQLLIDITERFRSVVRESDSIARLGGDEFLISLELREQSNSSTAEIATLVANKILESFKQPFLLEKGEYRVGTSIGICLIDEDCTNSDSALRRADTAMYRAKTAGGNRFAFYEPEMQRAADERLELEGAMLAGIRSGEFKAHFQPQLNRQGDVVGVEALIRWHRAGYGDVPPLNFIPTAERVGCVGDLQDIVVEQACELLEELRNRALIEDGFSMSINISPPQFDEHLEQQLMTILDRHNLPPSRFILEITESLLMSDSEAVVALMEQLNQRDFRFSVDDFGTGYSSLSYLHRFPIHELKIDKAFIDRMTETKAGLAIVDTIVALAEHLGCGVVAEGVEHAEQVAILSKRNIHSMQGYVFARPMSAEDFCAWITSTQSGNGIKTVDTA